jgi:formate dehydrogenase major subunit
MAEAHPVGFRWVMKARERGATVIHVDPRYSRTSAMSDLHVPIRAGSDIAFLGGLIRHVLETESYFRDYVVHYTNAATIVGEDFEDTEELGGLFSGYDPDTGTYDPASWAYANAEQGASATRHEHGAESFEERTGAGMEMEGIERDESLQDPRSVITTSMRRHFAHYTPEMSMRICGGRARRSSPRLRPAGEELGRERPPRSVYAVGWTHTPPACR